MSLPIVLSLTARLISFALALQAAEYFFLLKNRSFSDVWSLKNLKTDLEHGLPLPSRLIDVLFSLRGFRATVLLQMITALLAFCFPHPLLFIVLFLTHLVICIRFRGTFNGGSDMMSMVVLTGLLISFSNLSEAATKAGLIYISVHALYSYFKAGLAKIIHRDWRSGRALPAFLERSLYLDIQAVGGALGARPAFSFILAWSILIFELAALGLPLWPKVLFPYFVAAMFFHFMNSLSFGLNRFFWVWLAAWPAVFYAVNLAYSGGL